MNSTKNRYSQKPTRARAAESACPSLINVPANHQGGRCARAWLSRNVWLVAIALGWVFAFAMVFAPDLIDPAASAICAATLFGWSVGWIMRDERGRR